MYKSIIQLLVLGLTIATALVLQRDPQGGACSRGGDPHEFCPVPGLEGSRTGMTEAIVVNDLIHNLHRQARDQPNRGSFMYEMSIRDGHAYAGSGFGYIGEGEFQLLRHDGNNVHLVPIMGWRQFAIIFEDHHEHRELEYLEILLTLVPASDTDAIILPNNWDAAVPNMNVGSTSRWTPGPPHARYTQGNIQAMAEAYSISSLFTRRLRWGRAAIRIKWDLTWKFANRR